MHITHTSYKITVPLYICIHYKPEGVLQRIRMLLQGNGRLLSRLLTKSTRFVYTYISEKFLEFCLGHQEPLVGI